MRILALDPGEKKIGVALSDPTGLVARPLTTLPHTARDADAARIAALAVEQQAELILIGFALDAADAPGPQARRAERLADALRQHTSIPVKLHDESYSTQAAQATLLTTGKKRRRSPSGDRARRALRAQIHAVAAAAILQSYLDAHPRRD